MNKILQSLKLELLHVGYAKLNHTWDHDNVISPFSRMYLATKGTAKIFHSYEEVDLKPGHLYLVPSFTYSRYQCPSFHEQYYVHFLEEVGDGLSIFDFKDFRYELKATELDINCFERLEELHANRKLKNDDPGVYDSHSKIIAKRRENDLMSAKLVIETHGLLLLLFSNFIQNGRSTKMRVKSGFYEVLNYIKEHLHQPLSVSDLAQRFHLSPDHFSRVFQQKFGLRPSKYIQTVRIERSETLLLTTNNTLAEIADKTGWESVSYYTRIFKKTNGITPGEFRKTRASS